MWPRCSDCNQIVEGAELVVGNASMTEDSFIILLYHGVTNSLKHGIENCSKKHIPGDDFDRQMEYLAKNYYVIPLSQLLSLKKQNTIPPRSVAITFDDGFENNFSVAFPILRQHGLPATFFLATGFINSKRVFWVDKVEYLLNETPLEILRLHRLDREYRLDSRESREHALFDIKRLLKSTPGMVDGTVRELEQKSKVQPKYDYDDYRSLSWDQVRRMRRSGLCDFGSHTVDHSILSHLSCSEKEYQIFASKESLEQELDEPVDLFSYPEGQEAHYDMETIRLVQSAGFSASPTAIFGRNSKTISDFQLRRNMVGFTASFMKCLEVNDASSS